MLDPTTAHLWQQLPEYSRENLCTYVQLLQDWGTTINLTSHRDRTTASGVINRHIADCIQYRDLVPTLGRPYFDVGSGAGFPGILWAIIDPNRGRDFFLVEPNIKRAAFLRTVARETSLQVAIISERIETVSGYAALSVSFRAFADPTKAIHQCAQIIRPETKLYFFVGETNYALLTKKGKIDNLPSYRVAQVYPSALRAHCGLICLERSTHP